MSEPFARIALWWKPAIKAYLAERPQKLGVGTALDVAYAIASFADREGRCYPAHPTIAERARVSTAQVERAIPLLRAVGVITTKRRRRNSLEYTIILDSARACVIAPNQDEIRFRPAERECADSNAFLIPPVHEGNSILDSARACVNGGCNKPLEHTNDDDDGENHEARTIVATLCSRAIAPRIAELAVREHPEAARVWAEHPDWRLAFPKADNPIALVTNSLKVGAAPPAVPKQPVSLVVEVFVPRDLSDDEKVQSREGHEIFRNLGKERGWA